MTIDQPELAAFVDRRLAACERAWAAGNYPALMDAVGLCTNYGRPLPAWVARATLDALAERYEGVVGEKRGRLANPKAEYRQNYIHYCRWDAVNELRDRQAELEPAGYDLRWEKIFHVVSEYLNQSRSIAFGGPDAIRKSYQLVQRAFRNGDGAKYFIAEFDRQPE